MNQEEQPVFGIHALSHFVRSFGLFVSSEFVKGEREKAGKRPYGTPVNSGNIWLSYTLRRTAAKGLGIGAGAVYSDEFFGTDENDIIMPGYTVINANIFYNQPKFRASIGMDNIGSKKYWDVFGTPQMPRRLMASLLFRF